MKIRPMGAEFHAGGRRERQSDMTNLIVAFRIFVKAPNSFASRWLDYIKHRVSALTKSHNLAL